MSDDTRQARIEAGAKALWEAEYNSAPWPVVAANVQHKYGRLAESVLDAADAVRDADLEAWFALPLSSASVRREAAAHSTVSAADAIGRGRMSEAEAERKLDVYGRACVALHMARHGPVATEEILADERAAIRRDLIALLTAAPAERGDLDTLTAAVGAWGERTFPNATDHSIFVHLRDELHELGDEVSLLPRANTAPIAEEAADCLTLLMHLAHRNGFSLLDEARKKFAVNQQRMWNTVTNGGYVKHDERETGGAE